MNQVAIQNLRRAALRALVSVALGLAALGAVLATFIVMQDNQDIRPVLIVTFCAFGAAGLCAPLAARKFNWNGALGVSLGGIVAGFVLRVSDIAFTDTFDALLAAATVIVAVIVGITARALVSRRRVALASAMSGVALAVAMAAIYIGVPRLLDQEAYVTVDRSVEPFSIRTLDGVNIRSDTWRGRVVVLSYWATWCSPCLAEIPEISALQKKYKSDSRIAVVALNAGTGGDTAEKAREFLNRRHFDVTTVIDDIKPERRKQGEAAISLGLKVVPTLFILNKDQKLVAVHAGFNSSEHLVATLSSRLEALATQIP
jgi:thiol-disulfide isomerase/thioredoxin